MIELKYNMFFLVWVCWVGARAHRKSWTFWLFVVLGTHFNKNNVFLTFFSELTLLLSVFVFLHKLK